MHLCCECAAWACRVLDAFLQFTSFFWPLPSTRDGPSILGIFGLKLLRVWPNRCSDPVGSFPCGWFGDSYFEVIRRGSAFEGRWW